VLYYSRAKTPFGKLAELRLFECLILRMAVLFTVGPVTSYHDPKIPAVDQDIKTISILWRQVSVS
jgi:hypothetical protein